MLTYAHTSILDAHTQTVVNTVNTVGVMGKGIAKAYKERYPKMYRRYRELCKAGKFEIGQLWLWKGNGQWVLNLPTKTTWRRPSELSYVEAGLQKFVDSYEERGITEISFPCLGCGNGGLDWGTQVKPIMERYLCPLPIPVYIHDYHQNIGQPEHHANGDAAPFKRSYEGFLEALRQITVARNGMFTTVTNGTHFWAKLRDDSGDLEIRRSANGDRVSLIQASELVDVWALLLKGPLTRQEMAGVARSEAYYLFGVISTLPFVRPLVLQPKNGPHKTGVELVERHGLTQSASDSHQSVLPWA